MVPVKREAMTLLRWVFFEEVATAASCRFCMEIGVENLSGDFGARFSPLKGSSGLRRLSKWFLEEISCVLCRSFVLIQLDSLARLTISRTTLSKALRHVPLSFLIDVENFEGFLGLSKKLPVWIIFKLAGEGSGI